MSKPHTSGLTLSEQNPVPLPRLVLARLWDGSCTPGAYPWDEWERYAMGCGVSEELAGLGRAVIREASQHAWSSRMQRLSGWADDGQAMIRLALKYPRTAWRRWELMLVTDGFQGRWNGKGEWVWR